MTSTETKAINSESSISEEKKSMDMKTKDAIFKITPRSITGFKGKLAQKITIEANKCGGLAIGGFPRDWVVRRQPFKDLDLWFKDKESATKFIARIFNLSSINVDDSKDVKDMKDVKEVKDNKVCDEEGYKKCIIKKQGHVFSKCKMDEPFEFENMDVSGYYPFERMQLFVSCNVLTEEEHEKLGFVGYRNSPSKIEVQVDVIVSPTFITNDFDVNSLCYDGVNLVSNDGGKVDESLVEKIKKGKASMLPDYIEAMNEHCITWIVYAHICRVENFINRNVFEIDNYNFSLHPHFKVYLKKRKLDDNQCDEDDKDNKDNKDNEDDKRAKFSAACCCGCSSCNCSSTATSSSSALSTSCSCGCSSCSCSSTATSLISTVTSSTSTLATSTSTASSSSTSCCCGCSSCTCSSSSKYCSCSCDSCSCSRTCKESLDKILHSVTESPTKNTSTSTSCCCGCSSCVCSSSSSSKYCSCSCDSCCCSRNPVADVTSKDALTKFVTKISESMTIESKSLTLTTLKGSELQRYCSLFLERIAGEISRMDPQSLPFTQSTFISYLNSKWSMN